jgi:hypothetical protein
MQEKTLEKSPSIGLFRSVMLVMNPSIELENPNPLFFSCLPVGRQASLRYEQQ